MSRNEPERKTVREAAVEVLASAGEPLKATEVARQVLERGEVRPGGKTPAATVAAMLAVENKKPAGLFVRTAPGTYALRGRGEP